LQIIIPLISRDLLQVHTSILLSVFIHSYLVIRLTLYTLSAQDLSDESSDNFELSIIWTEKVRMKRITTTKERIQYNIHTIYFA